MNTLERTRYILDLINNTSEQLVAYADDIWLDVDRSSEETIRAGAEQQIEFQKTRYEFARITAVLEELIRQDMLPDALEKIDDGADADDDRLVVQLDRSQPHHLDEEFTWKRPFAIRFGGETGQQNTWKAIYRWLLQTLAKDNREAFQSLVDADFATTPRGNHNISRQKKDVRSHIEVDGLFFEANYSSNDIRDRMREVLIYMGHDAEEVEIFLQEDRDAG